MRSLFGVGERSLFGDMRSLVRDVGKAIAFWDVGGRSLFGMWEVRSLFGVWEGDRFLGCKGQSLLGM